MRSEHLKEGCLMREDTFCEAVWVGASLPAQFVAQAGSPLCSLEVAVTCLAFWISFIRMRHYFMFQPANIGIDNIL